MQRLISIYGCHTVKVLITSTASSYISSQNLIKKAERYFSHITRKSYCCRCENQGADQLRSNCTTNQRLCFRDKDSKIVPHIKSKEQLFVAMELHMSINKAPDKKSRRSFSLIQLILRSLSESGLKDLHIH